MLFTTAVFVFLFLPLALVGFYAAPWPRIAAAWLFASSVFFYGYWMPEFTLLLLGSIVCNFIAGRRIGELPRNGASLIKSPRAWLVVGITLNLALLAYFKYANFFIDNLAAALGQAWGMHRVVLPIGISFFTFTQIAFLVDAYRAKVHDYRFVHYGLFVTYFPHLIAGPILHHAQMIPQFDRRETYNFEFGNFVAGCGILGIGLMKKVILADGIAPYADAVFNGADAGVSPTPAEAWLGALAYTLQLYFDFSGYSDMAIGLSWMFNVRLPINFNSPYRATSISDFWRRWHISLSTFLRDYLYIALGGNQRGEVRRYANLLTTMLLGGLWHGASWSFVFWGFLHGAFLIVNHLFKALCPPGLLQWLNHKAWFLAASWLLTIICVVLAWVFFRATTFDGAFLILQGMAGASPGRAGLALLWDAGLRLDVGIIWCCALGLIALVPFNSNGMGSWLTKACRERVGARSFVASFGVLAVLALVTINTARDSTSAFIYFNF
jgi:alginate O-acetyltransferase complex protein AlgI